MLNKWSNKNTLEKLSWIFFWVWVMFLFIMSIYPQKEGGVSLNEKKIALIRADYFIHFVSYLILSFSYLFSSYTSRWKDIKVINYYFFIGLLGYSFLNEILQIFIPSRAYNIYDGLSNIIGIILGFLLFLLFKRLFIKS